MTNDISFSDIKTTDITQYREDDVNEPTPYITTNPEVYDLEFVPFLVNIIVPDCGIPNEKEPTGQQ